MVDVEKASATDNEKMRGGWLADEVGMGKVSSIFFSIQPKLDIRLFVDFCVFPRFSLNLPELNLKSVFFCCSEQFQVQLR